jgi:galactose-6-phosphate isomerase
MALLDVSDILTDPDFVEKNLLCQRNAQTVGQDGIAVITPTITPFFGVVTNASGMDLRRTAEGEIIYGSIFIATRFQLIDGKTGFTADIIQRGPGGLTYTVRNVAPYAKFGRGFVQAICDLIPLSG